MNESGKVVILAPMNLEYKAMRAHLRELASIRHRTGTSAEVGTLPGVPWPVALVVTGEGNQSAGALAGQVADWLRPVALLVVGVAGGLRDDIELGDVVVATWVYGIHGGKEDAGGFRARPRTWEGAHALVQAARMVDITGTWTELLATPAKPAVHFKPIAAGDVVLNSRTAPLAIQLKLHYDDAVAIETESAGAAAAAHLHPSLPVLTVRGISDKADGRKHRSDAAGLQPLAASHAAAFTVALLRELAAAPDERAANQLVGAASEATAQPAEETSAGGLAWRPLAETLPTSWLPELAPARTRASAFLELHLMPASQSAPLEARRLAALRRELSELGRTRNLFDPGEGLSASDPATVVSAAGNGLAVTRSGQRSAWMPLPKDTWGAVLDPADVVGRLADLLSALLRIQLPSPAEAGLAVGITSSILLSEGDVPGLPRTSTRQRTSMTPVRVPAADVLSFADVTASPRNVAAELSARLLLAFRARTAGPGTGRNERRDGR